MILRWHGTKARSDCRRRGEKSEKVDRCVDVVMNLAALMESQLVSHTDMRTGGNKSALKTYMKSYDFSCLSTNPEVFKFVLNNDLKSGEKKDIAWTRYFGCWNSMKECMEWTELVGDLVKPFQKGGHVEDFAQSKKLFCWCRGELTQGDKTLHHDPLLAQKVSSSVNTCGRKPWKNRARGHSQSASEFVLEDEDSSSAFPFLGNVEGESCVKKNKMKIYREVSSFFFLRRLLSSLAIHYDFLMLELPGAWKPPDSSKTLPFGED